jgi:hypothetical protein
MNPPTDAEAARAAVDDAQRHGTTLRAWCLRVGLSYQWVRAQLRSAAGARAHLRRMSR